MNLEQVRSKNSMRILFVLALCVVALACSHTRKSRADKKAFRAADLIEQLRMRGLELQDGGEIKQPFFAPKGRLYQISGNDLQVFEYSDPAAAEEDTIQVAVDGVSIGTTIVNWTAPPHFFRRDRVIAIYIGKDAQVLSLLKAILGDQFAGRIS